jgi:hypothetical protein
MELKCDLIKAIELNESVLDLDKDINGTHLNIICEIRARLLEGNSLSPQRIHLVYFQR